MSKVVKSGTLIPKMTLYAIFAICSLRLHLLPLNSNYSRWVRSVVVEWEVKSAIYYWKNIIKLYSFFYKYFRNLPNLSKFRNGVYFLNVTINLGKKSMIISFQNVTPLLGPNLCRIFFFWLISMPSLFLLFSFVVLFCCCVEGRWVVVLYQYRSSLEKTYLSLSVSVQFSNCVYIIL